MNGLPTPTTDTGKVLEALDAAVKALARVPTVTGTVGVVDVVAVVTVTIPYPYTPENFHKICDVEKGLYEKFPDVLFDFRLKYEGLEDE